MTSRGSGSTWNGRVPSAGQRCLQGVAGERGPNSCPTCPDGLDAGDIGPKTTTRPATGVKDGQPGPAEPPLFRRSGGQEDPVGNGSEEPRGHKLAFACSKHGDSRPGAVADEVLDEVFGPGQGAGPERRHPGPPAAQCEDEGRCACRVRRAQAPGHFFLDPFQDAHRPAEFVQSHDGPHPRAVAACGERAGGIQQIEMRFVLAAEELIDDESQGSVGAAIVARDQSQMTVCRRKPPELGDPLLFGKVQQPQPDPVAAPVRGKRQIPGEGRCDGTAWGAAAGASHRPRLLFPSAGPPPGLTIAGPVLPAEPRMGSRPGGRLRNSIASITLGPRAVSWTGGVRVAVWNSSGAPLPWTRKARPGA